MSAPVSRDGGFFDRFFGDAWYRVLTGEGDGVPVLTVTSVFGDIVKGVVELCGEHGGCPPVFLFGGAGIGKTMMAEAVARRYAEEHGLEFINVGMAGRFKPCRGASNDPWVHRCLVRLVERDPDKYMLFFRFVASHYLPEDIIGVPVTSRGGETLVYRVPLAMRLFSVEGVRGLLFIDEVTNVAREDVKSMLMALLDERVVGASNVRLSSRVAIVAAGNRQVDSILAQAPPEPLLNRGLVVLVTPPFLHEWRRYMDEEFGGRWCRSLYAALSLRPSLFHAKPRSSRLLGFAGPYPSPRAWSNAALLCRACSGWELGERCAEYMKAGVGVEAATLLLETVRVARGIGVEPERLVESDAAVEVISDFVDELLGREEHGIDSKLLTILLDTVTYGMLVNPEAARKVLGDALEALRGRIERLRGLDKGGVGKLVEEYYMPLLEALRSVNLEFLGELRGFIEKSISELLGRDIATLAR